MNSNTQQRNPDLITSTFMKILLPALVAGASSNISNMIDGTVVGNCLGSNAFAAVTACRPANQIFGFLSVILALGLANCIARSIGQNEKDEADRSFTTCLITAVAIALILIVVQVIFIHPICRLFADNETLYPMVYEYYRITLFSSFFVLINEVVASAMRTDGLPRLAGMVALLPHILNAALDLLFIVVFKMGLTGAALATVIGYVLGTALCCYYLIFKRSYRLRRGGYLTNLASIVMVGTPPALNIGLIAIKLLILNNIVVSLGGADAMAIFSVIMVAWALESLFISGSMQTVIPMISFYYGNGDYHGVCTVFRHAFRVLMCAEGVLLIFFEIIPQALALLFGLRGFDLLSDTAVALRIFAITVPIEAFIMLTIIYYSSTGDKKSATILSAFQGLLATAIVIFPLSHFFGIDGVWISFPASALITLLIILIMSRCSVEKFFNMTGNTYLAEFSVDRSRISEIVESVIASLNKAGIDKKTANRTGMAVEEMAVSAFDRNKGKRIHIDVTVRKTETDTILVTFADDGAEFNPVDNIEAENAEEAVSNLAVLRAISQKIEYGRVIGINKTDISLMN